MLNTHNPHAGQVVRDITGEPVKDSPDARAAALMVARQLGLRTPNDTIEPYTTEWYANRIDCAAIRTSDGEVWTGKRHGHCFQTIKQAYGVRSCEVPGNLEEVQGFVTMTGRFVNRSEAAEMVKKTGQVQLKHSPTELYSEDLY